MKKILVRAPNWLGDAVMSTPFLTRLKEKYPDSQISVYSQPYLARFYQSHPAVSQVLVVEARDIRNLKVVAKRLREENFDEVYNLLVSTRSYLEIARARIPKRIGFRSGIPSFVLTEAHPVPKDLPFVVRNLTLIDNPRTLNEKSMVPFFPKKKSEFGEKLKKPILGIAPVSAATSRTWDLDRYLEVARWFVSETGGSLVLFGKPSDRTHTQEIAKRLKESVLDSTGILDISKDPEQFGGVMAHCDLFLGNDSGLMHVAYALGVPSVVIFGAGSPEFSLPHSSKMLLVQRREIFCVPCIRNECVRFGAANRECLKAITVEEVRSKIRTHLSTFLAV